MKNKKLLISVLILLMAWALPCYADITTGLVGWWRLDDGGGTAASDSSGSGNTGSLSSPAPAWVAGKIGTGALSFNGSNNYVQITGLMGTPTDVTISAWANLSADGAASGSEIVSIGDYIALRLDETDFPGHVTSGFYRGSDTNFYFVSNNTSYAGTGWHHFVFVFDHTNNARNLYVDGSVSGSTDTSGLAIGYTGDGSNTFIGRHGASSANFFNGSIDDVRVYNRALTASDVAQLYAYTSPFNGTATTIKNAVLRSGKFNF
jgi:hypothetical protein